MWIITGVDYHWRGLSLAWIITGVDYHWCGLSLAWIITGVDYHWRGLSLVWIITGVDYSQGSESASLRTDYIHGMGRLSYVRNVILTSLVTDLHEQR